MASGVVDVAWEAYSSLINWYQSLAESKPKGYKLSIPEESKRQNLVDTAREAAQNAVDDSVGNDLSNSLWIWLKVEEFDAVTTPSEKQAVESASWVKSNARNLQAMNPNAETAAHLAIAIERAQFILDRAGKRSALTWADELGCGAEQFWGPCGAQNNTWLLWAVGIVALAWYARKRKWI